MKYVIISVCESKLKKENKELQQNIRKASQTLAEKIVQYYKDGVKFECIYNAENIKYDKHGDYFYTYKARGKNNSQLRILYACIQAESVTYVIIVDYLEKRKTGNKGHKDHLEKFSRYDSIEFEEFCKDNDILLDKLVA